MQNKCTSYRFYYIIIFFSFYQISIVWWVIVCVVRGWKHGQVDKKSVMPKMQFKNDNFFNIDTWK
jgi:hypothetical protein